MCRDGHGAAAAGRIADTLTNNLGGISTIKAFTAEDREVARQPVLPATLDAEAESLLLRRPGSHPGEILVLRLWPAPAALDDGTPLWLGSTQTSAPSRDSGCTPSVVKNPPVTNR